MIDPPTLLRAVALRLLAGLGLALAALAGVAVLFALLSACGAPTGTGPDPCDDAAASRVMCGDRADASDAGG